MNVFTMSILKAYRLDFIQFDRSRYRAGTVIISRQKGRSTMDFRKFYDSSTFTLFAIGNANWDLYTMQYKDEPPCVVSLAKPGSGATDSFWRGVEASIKYLDLLDRRGIKHGYVRV